MKNKIQRISPELELFAAVFVNLKIVSNLLLLISLLFIDFKQIINNYITINPHIIVIFSYILLGSYIVFNKKITSYSMDKGIILMLGAKNALCYFLLENLTTIINFGYLFLMLKFVFYRSGMLLFLLILLDIGLTLVKKVTVNKEYFFSELISSPPFRFFIGNLVLSGYIYLSIKDNKIILFLCAFQILILAIITFTKKMTFFKSQYFVFLTIALLTKTILETTSITSFVNSYNLSLGVLSLAMIFSKKKYCNKVSIERMGLFLLYLKQVVDYEQQQKYFKSDYSKLVKKTYIFLLIPIIINFGRLNFINTINLVLWYILDINLDYLFLLFNRKIVDKNLLVNIAIISDFGIGSAFMLGVSGLFLFENLVISQAYLLIALVFINILTIYIFIIWLDTFFSDIYLKSR